MDKVFPVSTPSTAATIHCLKNMLAVVRLPVVVVPYDIPAFKREEYKVFLRRNGIRQIIVPKYRSVWYKLSSRIKECEVGGWFARAASQNFACIPDTAP